MTQPRTISMTHRFGGRRSLTVALYLNAILLLAIVVLMGADRAGGLTLLPAAMAQSQPPIAGGGGVYVMPTQLSANNWGCYLLDTDAQTLCVYSYYPGERTLRLLAARDIRYDRKLGNYNTDRPSPQEVRDLLEKQAAAGRIEMIPPAPPATAPTAPGAVPPR